MVRFLHTSDWQLGMTRYFLDDEAQSRFDQDRLDVVARLAVLSRERGCAFVVVAGDVFETNQPDPRTITRAMEALATFDVPVYLLPGNHDTYDPGSVYRHPAFLERRPDLVEVLVDNQPRTPVTGVEVVGAPWTSKRPLSDPVTPVCEALAGGGGARRVVVGHGQIDAVVGDHRDPGSVRLDELEMALAAGGVDYVALGDRHAALDVGDTGRVWYSGAPEATSFREVERGCALVVELADGLLDDPPKVEPVEVGRWRFHEIARLLDSVDDVRTLVGDLDGVDDKPRAVVRLSLQGTLDLEGRALLDTELERLGHAFASLELPERHTDLQTSPTPDDLAGLGFSGYVAAALEDLRTRSEADGDDAVAAGDALALLVRLARQEPS